jgi:hypothetical protein
MKGHLFGYAVLLLIVLGASGCIVWDELTIGKVKDIVDTVSSKFGGYNSIFSSLQEDVADFLDKTVKVRSAKLYGSETEQLKGTDIDRYLGRSYLQDNAHADPWNDIWQDGRNTLRKYRSLQDDGYGYITANPFYRAGRDYQAFVDGGIQEEKELVKEMQNDASALGDIRKWQVSEGRKLAEWEKTALAYAGAKENPADSLQLGLQITLEMENIMQVSQQVALLEMELVRKIKARIREIDRAHHLRRLQASAGAQENSHGD